MLIYFHIVALGAILLSGFWSVMAESFDPHSAKQIFGRIAAAGTLGGITGGLMAERIAAVFSADGVLLLLAALHLACSGVLGSLQRVGPGSPRTDPRELISPVELFRRAPYLSAIAVVVLAGTSAAAILDYLFKAGAGAAFGKGAPLLRFFAVFYTCTQILTFFSQTFLAPRSLRRIGIGRTISDLAAWRGSRRAGRLAGPDFSGVHGVSLAGVRPARLALSRRLRAVVHAGSRGHKACSQNPDRRRLRPRRRCAGQRDRAAHALVRGIVHSLWAAGCHARPWRRWASGPHCGWIAAYSELLQQRLIDRAVELDLDGIQDSTTRSAIIRAPVTASTPPASEPAPTPAPLPDETFDVIRELRSGDSRRVLAALKDIDRLRPIVAAQLVSLLAWDEVSDAVREALQQDPRPITGLLIDHLTNQEGVEFGVRRRIPRILAQCDSQLAVQGLLAGLSDMRFEVRFQCSRSLDSLVQRRLNLTVPAEVVFAAVERELQVARPIRESRRLLDRRDKADPNAFLDEILRERADQTLEHIFSLFATVLPREAVKIAFRALHTDDKTLRGVAIEYLDSVLPAQVQDGLWAMIETKPLVQVPEARSRPARRVASLSRIAVAGAGA